MGTGKIFLSPGGEIQRGSCPKTFFLPKGNILIGGLLIKYSCHIHQDCHLWIENEIQFWLQVITSSPGRTLRSKIKSQNLSVTFLSPLLSVANTKKLYKFSCIYAILYKSSINIFRSLYISE